MRQLVTFDRPTAACVRNARASLQLESELLTDLLILQRRMQDFSPLLCYRIFSDGLDANAELVRRTGIDSDGELTLDVKRFTDQWNGRALTAHS
jgi:hypothetical protein